MCSSLAAMKSRWSDGEARQFCDRYAPRHGDALAMRVYTSRLIGAESDLVMHGGGNTSVKVLEENLLGDRVEALCIKGSGWDLDSIEPQGFPAIDLGWLRRLRKLTALSDEEMVLLKHGLFTFGADARESYERMIEYVDRAESFLRASFRGRAPLGTGAGDATSSQERMGRIGPILRGLLATASGNPDQPHRRVILEHRATPELLALIASPRCASLAARGPLTPDHVIRTKGQHLFIEKPALQDPDALRSQLASAIAGYRTRYDAYFADQVRAKGVTRSKLDPDPRVFVVPGVGIVCAGKTRKDAAIPADIAQPTLRIKDPAEAISRYEPLDESDLFDVEYWSLEQAKLGKETEKPLSRQVALVTGAAGGLGGGSCTAHAKGRAPAVGPAIDPAALD